MVKVIGIRFKKGGKKYYFEAPKQPLNLYEKVVVETVRGVELGEVIEQEKEISEKEIISTLKPILRVASNKDIQNHDKNVAEIPDVVGKCKECIKKHQLEMKLLDCEYTLDRSKLVIYFNAEGRIDFRELVKDLANIFKVRIELRQVGTRDGAKFFGGIGPCGLIVCCNTFLGDFDTVSIKMAKNQNLSLNPINISGLCDKLLCCIKYEDNYYKEARNSLPLDNTTVQTPEGNGKVLSSNIFDKTVKVQLSSGELKVFKNTELKFKKKLADDESVANLNELKGLE